MTIALLDPIPDSERFIELAETPPLMLPADLPPSPPPLRPRRSSQRGLQIFSPASHDGEYDDASRKHSIIDLYSSRRGGEDGDHHDGPDTNATPADELFYSPLSSPALMGTIHQSPAAAFNNTTKQRNRTSEIPVLPASYHNNVTGKEAGVRRAFRSKVGTDGSISLSILPSAAALSEMLELNGEGGSPTAEIISTYQPATAFTRSVASLHAKEPPIIDTRRGSAPNPTTNDVRRGSAVSTGSVNTRPLTIKRKKPAVYHPESEALPISRTASFDACTPTTASSIPPLPFSTTTSALNATPQSSPTRSKYNSDLALPVTQTFQTPLRRIPQSDVTPPATPPTWTGSTHSDTYTEEESLIVSPRSSRDRKVPPQAASSTTTVNARKLESGAADPEHGALSKGSPADEDDAPPKIPRRPTNDYVDLEFLTPQTCSIEDMQDRPGILRRESDDESDDLEYDDDDDDDSDHDFGLESFPVPSVILSSPRTNANTPRMYPVSPNVAGRSPASAAGEFGRFNPDITASPAHRKASIASSNEWDQATELEVRDRVFRAEIKKPSKTDKARRKALQKVFDQLKRPTKLELYEASLYSVRDENGHKVRFGTLFEEKKTIVCFIRHFW
ncbi:hypothetical protein P389DRAFT_3098 [Cystobasidium minutum MCA 4210]|uniref:uncharacterized protein n=1 Tax=Cystobasidium minutum MCA 4210 TaxID=1397322 RepID=UPI0034CFC7B1|eukprot:jgi/Rhomi1/3098/CE3097_2216